MVAYLVRNDLRRQWRSVLLLTVLVALVLGAVLASVAGARRSRTAYDRYAEQLAGPDAIADGDPAALAELGRTDGIAEMLPLDLLAAFPPDTSEDEFYPMAVSTDGAVPYEHLRSPVVHGRLPELTAPFEVAVSERTARRLDLEVGSVLPLVTYRPGPDLFSRMDGPPDGPEVELTVVGVVRDPGDIGSRETDITLTFLTPAFREVQTVDEIGSIAASALMVLEPDASLATISAAAQDLDVNLDVSVSGDSARGQAQPTMVAIATALYVFAAVVGLAGAATLGHVMARLQQPGREDGPTLRALGVRPSARAIRVAAPAAVALTLGTVLGVMVAIAASPLFPIGLARRAEPDQGVDVDAAVIGAGAVAAIVLGVLVVAATSLLSVRRAETPRARRVSRIGHLAASAGAPPPLVTGLAFGGRRSAGAAGPAAIGGVTLGVLGLLSAIAFASSVDHLVDTPELYGWGWDGNVAGADLSDLEDEARAAVGERLLADPDLAAVGSGVFQLALRVDEEPTLATAVGVERGRIEPTVVRGRAPVADDEVALGRDTLHAVGKDVGDTVHVSLDGPARPLRITGVVALPVSSDGGTSTSGAYLPKAAATRLGFTTCGDEMSCYENVVFRVAPGADAQEMETRYANEDLDITVDLPTPPAEIERLTAVEDLPWFLAAFLALLATVATLYGATTAVRQHRRDLAVLRALGMTARHVREVVVVLVLALTSAGALLGGVLGIVVGRVVWRAVVTSMSLPFAPSTPLLAAILVPVAAVVLAQLVATTSRRAAARVPAALVLRAE